MATIPIGTSFPLAWSNGTRTIQTTIEQISYKKIRFPALDLKDGVLCISKDRRYQVTPLDPQSFTGFQSLQIEGVKISSQFANGRIEFKIPSVLDITRNGDNPNFYGKKRFQIMINKICFDSEPFILMCQPITLSASHNTTKTAVAVLSAIKKSKQASKRKKGIPSELFKPNPFLKVAKQGTVKFLQHDPTKLYSVEGSEIT